MRRVRSIHAETYIINIQSPRKIGSIDEKERIVDLDNPGPNGDLKKMRKLKAINDIASRITIPFFRAIPLVNNRLTERSLSAKSALTDAVASKLAARVPTNCCSLEARVDEAYPFRTQSGEID